MKKVTNRSIINIENTDKFDNKFLFELDYINYLKTNNEKLQIIKLQNLLEKRKNLEMLEKSKTKPAIYSNVYSPKDELEIFKELFDDAIKNNKKIHIVGVTLKEEIEILETYYEKLGFIREEINCFDVDFSIPLVTVGVNIENLMWKGSDYKRMRDKIFFNPPIRESGQVKAMFKGINRGVIAGINISELNIEKENFLKECITEEKILPITLAKVLKYNLKQAGFIGKNKELIVQY